MEPWSWPVESHSINKRIQYKRASTVKIEGTHSHTKYGFHIIIMFMFWFDDSILHTIYKLYICFFHPLFLFRKTYLFGDDDDDDNSKKKIFENEICFFSFFTFIANEMKTWKIIYRWQDMLGQDSLDFFEKNQQINIHVAQV